MLRQLLQRVLYTLPVIWLVVSLVFLLIHLVPGDPIQQMLGEGAPPADIQATRHAYGLDRPLGEQYIRYWKGVLHGDLGPSFRYNQTVTHLMAERYPYTMELTLASLFIAIILSFPAGVYSAQHPNRWEDRLISVVSLFGLSFPNIALPLSWVGCRFPVLAASSIWCCPPSPWADLWPPSSPAWCARPCSKS